MKNRTFEAWSIAAAFIAGAAFLSASAIYAAGEPTVRVVGPETVIYNSTDGDCGPGDIVDAPLRAIRVKNGYVLATAGWWTNRMFRGKSLAALKKDCHSAYTSAQIPNPAAFDDFSWLMSLWTDDGSNVQALAHHEYLARLYPGQCDFQDANACMYDSITAFKSSDSGFTFQRASSLPVAAPRDRQSPSTSRIVGIAQQSNIIRRGKFHYFIALDNGDGQRIPGECIFRSRNLKDTSSWEYLTEAGWVYSSYSAYAGQEPPPPCRPLKNLGGIVWSILRRESNGLFLALLTVPSLQANRVDIAIATSSDLINWSAPKRFYTMIAAWNYSCDEPYRYSYPSLIDPASASRNFETIASDAILYMARITIKDCKMTMQRDLIAIPVKLE